jgi:hypothetical protein
MTDLKKNRPEKRPITLLKTILDMALGFDDDVLAYFVIFPDDGTGMERQIGYVSAQVLRMPINPIDANGPVDTLPPTVFDAHFMRSTEGLVQIALALADSVARNAPGSIVLLPAPDRQVEFIRNALNEDPRFLAEAVMRD